MNKTLLIIDPLHSNAYFYNKMKNRNIRTIAIFSNLDNIMPFNRPGKNLFDRQICIENEDVDAVIDKIGEKIDFVLNGSDQHLNLCEKISKKITPSLSNDPQTSHYRNDKFSQQELMKKNNFNSIEQILVDMSDLEVIDFSRLSYPVFAKPSNGGGSIGIFKADDPVELKEKLESAPQIVNFDPITHYLVQEYINGDEIIIDAFSHAGNHHIGHIYTYTKSTYKNVPIYRTMSTITHREMLEKASEFTRKVLDCCLVGNGFSHIELFYVRETEQFYLIELNPRISGASGVPNIMAESVNLNTQPDMLSDFLFSGKVEDKPVSNPMGFASSVLMYNHQEVNLESMASVTQLIELSVQKLDVERAPDLTDLRKIVVLAHDQENILKRNEQNIIEMDII
ncbi:ATP-grasp domain-containing protein [uncultured Shewanella sp.]|uniref:ATP-grasp domain-containing protein n=1 Tax=uncultured Shewanella sp. TaxID=173975 RepID=UPI002624CB8C|nr:ATP-grasp domain-containing protein [uncultured Shewanella sp.]